MESKILPHHDTHRTVTSSPSCATGEDPHARRQAALLEFLVAAGWRGATAKRLARMTFGEPEFPVRQNVRLSAIYRDLHELARQGKVECLSSSRPMEWIAAGARP